MAFKPSARRIGAIIKGDGNMLPILGLMCILIPLLLSSTQTVKLGMIEIRLPPASSNTGNQSSREPVEKEAKLDASRIITDKGFIIGSTLGVAGKAREPTIVKKGDRYDFAALNSYLAGLKLRARNYPDIDRITITAEEGIPYKYMVKTIDAAREYRDVNGIKKSLFPVVSIAAGLTTSQAPTTRASSAWLNSSLTSLISNSRS